MSKYKCIRKGLLSVVAVMAAAVMLGGCGNEAAEKAVPDNYAYEPITVEPLRMERTVKTVATCNDGTIRFKEAYIGTMSGHNAYGNYVEDSTGFVVNYSFNNASGKNACMLDLAGQLRAYQNGIELSYQMYGDYTESTDILSGHSIDLTKVFITSNKDDPVELISGSLGYENYHAVMTPKVEVKMLPTTYELGIKGAGFTDSGKIVVDSTYTNTSNISSVPAKVYAVQAYQGDEQLFMVSESTDNDGYLLKWFAIEPNETSEISTTFLLNDYDEEVVVYLTDPATGRPFVKKIYSR